MNKRYQLKFTVGLLLLVTVLLLSVYTVLLQLGYARNAEEAALTRNTRCADAIHQLVSNKFTKEDFETINSMDDMSSARYQELQQELNELRTLNSTRYLYTAGRNGEGALVYLVDGLDLDAEDFAYPGTYIEEEMIPYIDAALSGETIYSREIVDTTWGHIFTACYPVMSSDGSGEVIGVAPAPEYTFRILVTPVGPYFKGGLKPIKLRVSEYDRAAPHGTGNIKAGLNYAMSLRPTMEAHRSGYAENIYLDSQSRTYIEETGGANVLFVKQDGTLVVPKSHTDSILPSITRRSLVQVAQDLGMTVDERYVTWEEVAGGEFVECGLCGTAAVISPVGQIDNKVNGADQEVVFPAGCTEIGPVMKQLRETLTGIQDGNLEDKHGWVCKIDVD